MHLFQAATSARLGCGAAKVSPKGRLVGQYNQEEEEEENEGSTHLFIAFWERLSSRGRLRTEFAGIKHKPETADAVAGQQRQL